jgi:protein phosphatase
LITAFERTARVIQTSVAGDGLPLWSQQGLLMMVADGVGGHAAGEVASEVAVRALAQYALSRMTWSLEARCTDESNQLTEQLRYAVVQCEEKVNERAEADGIEGGPATTLTAAYVAWPIVSWVHAGDSRAYLYRDGILRQLTQDHTVAAQLGGEGPHANHVLLNCVGGGGGVEPEVGALRLRAGDALLLCTDGLTGHLTERDLVVHLDEVAHGFTSGAQACVRAMLGEANASGGVDNVTAILARF